MSIICKASNFSHRIDNFSFGDNSDLVHNALNYELKIAEKGIKIIYSILKQTLIVSL